MRLLFVGDIHLRGDNPVARKDNYYETAKMKLQEVFDIAVQKNVDRIIQVGDLFNAPVMSLSVLADFMKFLKSQKHILHCIPGNHDMFGHNPATLHRTVYGLLSQLGYINDVWYVDNEIEIIGTGFSYLLDKDYSEYCTPDHPGKIQILVIHGMLLPESPGFEMRHSVIETAAAFTNADIIISGHYHMPFSKHATINGKCKLFFNPGALMRISATEEEMHRSPQVILLDVINGAVYEEMIALKSAKTGIEVLNRDHIEKQNLRDENMQKFIESLDITDESRFMDIQSILEKCAEVNAYTSEIVKEAIDRISRVKEDRNKRV